MRQRLTVKYIMQGLSQDEIKDYCSSRLAAAGLYEEVFTSSALEAIYAISNGLPRLVNNLAASREGKLGADQKRPQKTGAEI